jgi:hypothetical protein
MPVASIKAGFLDLGSHPRITGEILMSAINWNDGRLINLKGGDTATCAGELNPGQLYALFFYNSAGNDANAPVSVVWSNSQAPVQVVVPGTTANQGLAALCFVSGDDTNTVSASLSSIASGVQVQAFIGSVKMPVNTSGIQNKPLPLDGQAHSFASFTRYYAVLASHWYQGYLRSDINQFISVQFKENSAVVNIVNQLTEVDNVVKYAGGSRDLVTINKVTNQTLPWTLQGNGRQMVWINADSCQNSQTAEISLQSLAAVYDAFKIDAGKVEVGSR